MLVFKIDFDRIPREFQQLTEVYLWTCVIVANPYIGRDAKGCHVRML